MKYEFEFSTSLPKIYSDEFPVIYIILSWRFLRKAWWLLTFLVLSPVFSGFYSSILPDSSLASPTSSVGSNPGYSGFSVPFILTHSYSSFSSVWNDFVKETSILWKIGRVSLLCGGSLCVVGSGPLVCPSRPASVTQNNHTEIVFIKSLPSPWALTSYWLALILI